MQAVMHIDRLLRKPLGFREMTLAVFQTCVPVQQIRLIGKLLTTLTSDVQSLLRDALRVLIASNGDQNVLQNFQCMEKRLARDPARAVNCYRLGRLSLRLGASLLVE
jgi:hypothetical protein